MADPARALVLSGGPHPFHETTPMVVDLVAGAGWQVTVVDHPDDAAEVLARQDATLMVCNTLRWRMLAPKYDALRAEHAYSTTDAVRSAFTEHVLGGGLLLALHAAPICFDDWQGWGDLVGARWEWGTSGHPAHGPMVVEVPDTGHPVTSGVADFTIADEAYGRMWLAEDVVPLATSRWDGEDHPLLWARGVGRGHVVTDTLGHDASSFSHPAHQRIVRQSLEWLALHRSVTA